MKRMTYLVLVCTVFLSISGVHSQPWVQSFVPVREFYVSQGALGSGCCLTDPMSLEAAMANAAPGDLYWLLGGTYTGSFTFQRPGTIDNPIVYRGVDGQRSTIDGKLIIAADYNWFWGLEITDPDGSAAQVVLRDSRNAAVWFDTPSNGARVINSLIHDSRDMGMGVWRSGSHVVYGNTVFDNGIGLPGTRHGIYTQNRVDLWGPKFLVHNNVLSADGFLLHAYTEGGRVDGYHLEGNVFQGPSRVLLGGKSPTFSNQVLTNYFYDTEIYIGYFRPSQVTFTANYLGDTHLRARHLWCVDQRGDPSFVKPDRNVYTRNIFVRKTVSTAVSLSTTCFGPAGEGFLVAQPLDPIDLWDQNTYVGGFRNSAAFDGDQTQLTVPSLDDWRTLTAANGNEFDQSSVEIPGAPASRIVVIPNDYESGRGHIVVYNWDLAASVTVDLSPVVNVGQSYRVYPVKRPYDLPLLSGIYNGPVVLPIGGAEFGVFLIRVVSLGAPAVPTGLKIVGP